MKLLYSLGVLFISINLSAQLDFEVKDSDNGNATMNDGSIVNKITTPSGLEFPHHFVVKNNSVASITMTVRKYEEVLNSGAASYFCFDGACFLPGTNSSTIQVNAGASFSLIPKLDEGVAIGYSQIRYKVSANTNTASISVTLKYNAPAAVKETFQSFSSTSNVYPNPSNSKSFLDIHSANEINNVTVKIYNSLGSVVSNKQISLTKGKNSIEFETESFESGIYFASISQGKNLITKKITISK